MMCRPFGLGVLAHVQLIDDEAQRLGHLFRPVLVVGLELLAAEFDQLGQECRMLAKPLLTLMFGALAIARIDEEIDPLSRQIPAASTVSGEDSADLPIFLGNERGDLALALHHQTHGDGLHPTCRQTTGYLPP